jgi:hypothetical protein
MPLKPSKVKLGSPTSSVGKYAHFWLLLPPLRMTRESPHMLHTGSPSSSTFILFRSFPIFLHSAFVFRGRGGSLPRSQIGAVNQRPDWLEI